jgi:hypothetical protein
MKLPVLLFLCLAAPLAAAEPEVALQVLPQNEPAASPQYFVGGAPAVVRLALEAPVAAKLTVTGDLFQLGGPVAVPVQKNITLAEGVDFAQRTRAVIEAKIELPEVTREAHFRLVMRVQGADQEKPKPAGRVELVVYPHDHLDAFKKFLAAHETDGQPLLGLFGESKGLRAFFTQEKISFTDLGEDLPSSFNRKLVYLGEASIEKLTTRFSDEMRAIVFERSRDVLPGVYPAPRPAGFLIKVTLPMLDALPTDPLLQQTFARLIYQTLPDAPTQP